MSQDYLTNAFIRLRQRLRVISGRVIADSEGAEDVLQDSFVRLWRKQYPLRSEKEAEALLTRTVRNASLNEKRRRREVPLETDLVDESPDAAEKERAYDELKRKIDSELTSTQKYILEEKEYGGRTLEEIARELKMEPAAVRMQLSRARKKLKDSMSHE
ncbi:MAG: sigma-70 family RNA polymerase sigma factor [Bacteroidales bacterium]|nr:sigma-70 family RNA polymerase sigma factor [Bacteroidales bacterium]